MLGGWFNKVGMAGVLQEAGDADSRARTRSQAQVELYLSLCLHLTIDLLPKVSIAIEKLPIYFNSTFLPSDSDIQPTL